MANHKPKFKVGDTVKILGKGHRLWSIFRVDPTENQIHYNLQDKSDRAISTWKLEPWLILISSRPTAPLSWWEDISNG